MTLQVEIITLCKNTGSIVRRFVATNKEKVVNNVNTFLKENLSSVSKNVFVAPGIPEKKLRKVRISRSFLPKLTR